MEREKLGAKLTDAINEIRSNHTIRDRKEQQKQKQKECEQMDTRNGQTNESKQLKPNIKSKFSESQITKFNIFLQKGVDLNLK